MKRLTLPALAVLSGVLYFVGFVGFDQWYLSFVSLVPLMAVLHRASTGKQALLLAWLAGFVTQLGGFYWVIHLLREFAGAPQALAVVGFVLLSVVQGTMTAVAGWLAWKLTRRGRVPLALAFPVAFIAAEMGFPLLFPWYLGNSLAWQPVFIQTAELGGVLLVSLMIVLVNGAVWEGVEAALGRRRPAWSVVGAGAGMLAFSLLYAAIRMPQVDAADADAPKLRTAIIQANVGASAKHTDVMSGIRRYRRMTEEAMAQEDMGLVVWPESAFNRSVPTGYANLTGLVARQVKVPMIIGALHTDGGGRDRKLWNAALSIAPGGEVIDSYGKTVLLAFGEYIPGDSLWPGIYDYVPSGRFERGNTVEPLPVGPWKLSTNICYEDIIPRHVRSLMGPIGEDGVRPHAMVNITNDSWYGPAEPPQHLALAVFRSVEHRRWLIRSTATGLSAFVDSAGRLHQRSGFETTETLTADVPMITAGPTVYGVLGDWPGWLALALAALGLARPWIERRAGVAEPGSSEIRPRDRSRGPGSRPTSRPSPDRAARAAGRPRAAR